MIVKIHNQPLLQVQEKAIHTFLSGHRHTTIFQSPDFYTFYYAVKNFSPYYYLAYNEAGLLVGVLLAVIIREGKGLLSFLSSRCVVYGGPLVHNDDPGLVSELLQALNTSVSRLAILTQFRNFRIWNPEVIGVFNRNGFILHDHLNLIIDDSDSEIALKRMSSSRRRQVKKGLNSGAIIKPATSIEEVKELYELLFSLYRQKVRKPFPKWSFFEQFYTQLVPAGKGVILLVYYDEKLIGGIVSPVTPGKVMYELYICGLDKEYPKQYPSILASWAGLEWAAKNQVPAFDFLGLGKPGIPYGVRDFKLRFGGNTVNLGRFGRRNHHLIYSIAETGYTILRKLKRV